MHATGHGYKTWQNRIENKLLEAFTAQRRITRRSFENLLLSYLLVLRKILANKWKAQNTFFRFHQKRSNYEAPEQDCMKIDITKNIWRKFRGSEAYSF